MLAAFPTINCEKMVLEDNPRANEAQSPTRPGSAWTSNSLFADSAISLRTATPKPFDDETNTSETFEPIAHLADRLRELVSEIWASEQDGALRGEKRRRIEAAMDSIEAVLLEGESSILREEDGNHQDDETTNSPLPEDVVVKGELELIRNNLTLTIKSMRMRQQEHSHLHQLTMTNLEAVAQRCVQQETRMQEFSEEVILLRERNRKLTRENAILNDQLEHSRAESRKRDDAVHAMSSAVAGLDGWINSTPTPTRSSRKVVVRGRGRFRGRYYVDELDESPIGPESDAVADARTIHEGVNAWLRGFNDIEQELESTPINVNVRLKQVDDRSRGLEDDEWGEFETVSET